MELFEYIKSQLPQMPNTVIMKQLGASQELIDYVKETPENTNFAIAEVIEGSGGGGDAEVWLVGDEPHETPDMVEFTLRNVGETDHMTELYTNPNNYDIYLNGVNLPYRIPTLDTDAVIWGDNSDESQLTKMVYIDDEGGTVRAEADYLTTAEAPTSVEVSVKAK